MRIVHTGESHQKLRGFLGKAKGLRGFQNQRLGFKGHAFVVKALTEFLYLVVRSDFVLLFSAREAFQKRGEVCLLLLGQKQKLRIRKPF